MAAGLASLSSRTQGDALQIRDLIHFKPLDPGSAAHHFMLPCVRDDKYWQSLAKFAIHVFKTGDMPMATMNISLPDQMKEWVEKQTENGQYANSSDYVRDLIRRDRIKREKIAALQEKIDEGIASGPAQEFDLDELFENVRSEVLGERVDVD